MDTSGHHLVYGVLEDYLTGEPLPDTDDEQIRQGLLRHLVEDLGYAAGELQPRLIIVTEYGGRRTTSRIDLGVRINDRWLFILRYAPGSLVTREKAAIAAARVLDPDAAVPLAVVTNGRDAELLNTSNGEVLATGMESIIRRDQAQGMLDHYPPWPLTDPVQRDQAQRILHVFDEDLCCVGGTCAAEGPITPEE
ncbi:MAG: hypothetical protein CSA34_00725 [Desulfobulbus propionicus]|nr:MAG: hypothetical protein CSA34_00725 [Desulfobulbus propionicus]